MEYLLCVKNARAEVEETEKPGFRFEPADFELMVGVASSGGNRAQPDASPNL